MHADCDLMAMLSKDGYTISEQDSLDGDFNDPFDYFEYLMLMSNNIDYQPPYLSGLSYYARRKSNDDGYGFAFYRNGSNLISDNEYYVSDSLCQKYYERGEDHYYPGTVWSTSGQCRSLGFVYTRILNESGYWVPYDNNNETARIIFGHARKGTTGYGNHPYTTIDSVIDVNRTFTFMANGTIPEDEQEAMEDFLVNQNWWDHHTPNNYLNPTQITDSETFFHYIMYFIQQNNGNVEEGIVEALNQTDIEGENIREMILNPYDSSGNDFWSGIANFVLSDGESLYLFRNSPMCDLRHDLSYIDHGEWYGVKTLDPEGGIQLQQFDLVKLSPDHEPELHNDIFDMQIVNAPNFITNDSQFGKSVSIDGDFAVVGSPYDNLSGWVEGGAAYIYKKDTNGVWNFFQMLVLDRPSSGDRYGYSVSIDDDYIAIGCPGEDYNAMTNCGAVYRYKYNNLLNTWRMNQLTYGQNSNDQLGFSVAVNHGGYVAAGAPYYSNMLQRSVGRVNIYKTNLLTPPDGDLDHIQSSYGIESYQNFGWSVDINKHLAVAGGPRHDYNGRDSGSIRFIYFNDGTESAFTAPVEVSTRDYYGWDLDLDVMCDKASVESNPGGIDAEAFKTGPTGYDLIVGAPGDMRNSINYNYQGKAYISCRTIIDAEETFDYRPYFGYSVAIEEQQAVVGARDVHQRGAVYTYTYMGSVIDYIYAYGSTENQYFGCDVAYDAENMIIGANMHDNEHNCGAVYFLNSPSAGMTTNRGIAAIGGNYKEETPDAQVRTYLKGNYPNPFNPDTAILFSLKEATKASLTIYNMKGQKVKTLKNEYMEAGDHSIVWNGKDDNGSSVSSGIYFYKLNTNSYSKIRKMILMK